jgi:4-amino-4-deoxy-L-arabinose transferase-like glycosyltransferase
MRRLREALTLKPERVLWLVAAYCLAAMLLRVLRTEGLQADESEQVMLSQFLMLGYGRQPPFYNWLQYGVMHMIGPSIFALTLLKNALLFLCCLFFGLAARQLSERRDVSAAAILGVLCLPAVTVLSQRDLSHAVALLFCVSLFLYAFFGALTRPALWRYALTGVAIGIGMIAKYNFIVVPIAALVAILPEAELRRRLFDRRLIATIVIAALICLPHALWFVGNIDAATDGTIDEMRDDPTGHFLFDRLDGFVTLIGAAIKGGLPLIVFMLIAFGRELFASWKVSTVWTRVTGRMFLFCLVIVGLISFGMGATTISQKWLSPFLLVPPLYLCLKIEANGGFYRRPKGTALLAVPAMLLAFGFLIYLAAGNILAPLFGKYQKDSLPSVPFVREVLAEAGPAARPGYILADTMILAGSARLVAPDIAVAQPSVAASAGFVTPQKPGLVIWNGAKNTALPEQLAALLHGRGIDTSTLTPKAMDVAYPFSGGRDTERFNYAWIARP